MFTLKSTFWCCLLILVAILQSEGLSTEPSSKTLQVLVGEINVKLDCLIPKQLENMSVFWYLVDMHSTLLLSKYEWVKYPTSYSIEHDKDTRNYRLIIKNMNRLYQGFYRCELNPTESRISSDENPVSSVRITIVKIRVEVYELPPDPTVVCGVERTDVLEGEATTVSGSAFIGNIPANFKINMWDTKGNIHIMSRPSSKIKQGRFNSITLEVNITRIMDYFQCIVLHDLLPNDLSGNTPKLNVRYLPEFISMPDRIQYEQGNDLVIQINVIANPKAHIMWTFWRNDQLVDDTTLAQSVKGQSYLFEDKLLVNTVLMEHANITSIKIEAVNNVGNDTHIIKLYCRTHKNEPVNVPSALIKQQTERENKMSKGVVINMIIIIINIVLFAITIFLIILAKVRGQTRKN